MTLSIPHKTLIACLALGGWGLSHAQTPPAPQPVQTQSTVQTQSQEQLKNRETLYHGELLSEQERNAYMERMRLAKTEQEREQIRLEHREKMDLRLRALNQNKATPSGSGMGKNQGGHAPIILPKQGAGRN